jgi:hypothetical protein
LLAVPPARVISASGRYLSSPRDLLRGAGASSAGRGHPADNGVITPAIATVSPPGLTGGALDLRLPMPRG